MLYLLAAILIAPLVFQAWLYLTVLRMEMNHIDGFALGCLGLVPYLGTIPLADKWAIKNGWKEVPRGAPLLPPPDLSVGKVLPFPDRDALIDDYRLDPLDPDDLEIP